MVMEKPADLISRKPALLAIAVSSVCMMASDVTADMHHFNDLGPGAELPSSRSCVERIRGSVWEPRVENYEANYPAHKGIKIDGANASFNANFANRIDGSFAGTTDEIIRWGACKWGFDEDVTRARAVQESYWRQSQVGDMSYDAQTCSIIGQETPCWQSYGILQVKVTVHEGTYPLAVQSTAYNVDYAMGWLRACYEGAFSHWLKDGYAKGDEWGCIGLWYSGKWYDEAANKYIERVKSHLDRQTWKRPGF
jgi:autotransporter family porin